MNIDAAKSSPAFVPLIQSLALQGIQLENLPEKMQDRIYRLVLFFTPFGCDLHC